ncbi:hypothetical protein BOTBODRAFT_388785 [Botryobasidium botryosum FD-172 SS1]|uniref:Uncharacterized protein n=1 Tax=Botryobasidium botryosum (strain FD-172 SS1) TaxID=930990 RepID=A0A067MX20_BOTB1|nr:hypothetical protein BOTBODRAFT_388785 [Botryobasidium botryosum FD-172 SS1]
MGRPVIDIYHTAEKRGEFETVTDQDIRAIFEPCGDIAHICRWTSTLSTTTARILHVFVEFASAGGAKAAAKRTRSGWIVEALEQGSALYQTYLKLRNRPGAAIWSPRLAGDGQTESTSSPRNTIPMISYLEPTSSKTLAGPAIPSPSGPSSSNVQKFILESVASTTGYRIAGGESMPATSAKSPVLLSRGSTSLTFSTTTVAPSNLAGPSDASGPAPPTSISTEHALQSDTADEQRSSSVRSVSSPPLKRHCSVESNGMDLQYSRADSHATEDSETNSSALEACAAMREEGGVEEAHSKVDQKTRPAGRVIDLTFRNFSGDEVARKEYEAATDSTIRAILGGYGEITGVYRWKSKRHSGIRKPSPHLFIEFVDEETAERARCHQRETWKMIILPPNPNFDLYQHYLKLRSDVTVPGPAPVALVAAIDQKNRQNTAILDVAGAPRSILGHDEIAPPTGAALAESTLQVHPHSATSETSTSVTPVNGGAVLPPPSCPTEPVQAIHIFPNPNDPSGYEAFQSLSDEELRAHLAVHGEITDIYRWQKAPRPGGRSAKLPHIFISFATPDAAASALRAAAWNIHPLSPGEQCYESYLRVRQEVAHQSSRAIGPSPELSHIAPGQSSQSDGPAEPTTSSLIAGSGGVPSLAKRVGRVDSGQGKGTSGETPGSQLTSHDAGPSTLELKEPASTNPCSSRLAIASNPSNALVSKRKVALEDSSGPGSPDTLPRPAKRPRSDSSTMATDVTCSADLSAHVREAEEQNAALRARVSQLEEAQMGLEAEGAELRKRCSVLEAQLAQSREERDRLAKTADSASIIPSLLGTFIQIDELLREMAELV